MVGIYTWDVELKKRPAVRFWGKMETSWSVDREASFLEGLMCHSLKQDLKISEYLNSWRDIVLIKLRIQFFCTFRADAMTEREVEMCTEIVLDLAPNIIFIVDLFA